MDSSSPSTDKVSTNSPQIAPKQEEETLAKGNWRSEEENALVAAVNEAGEGNWASVQKKLVEKGFAKRGLEAVHQHYTVLSARAQAKGVPLTGALPLDPWTDDEGALLLAINRFVQEEATARNLPYIPVVTWSRFLSFFPGRSSTDLSSQYKSVRTSEERGSHSKRFERVKAKKDEAYETIKRGLATKKSSPAFNTSSCAATSGASPTAQVELSTRNATSGNVQSTFSSTAQPADSSLASLLPSAAALPLAQPSSSVLAPPSSTFILPRLVVTAATQTDFPPSPSPISVSAQAILSARSWSPFNFKDKGVDSAGTKRVRAIFDEGRTVFKKTREVFEQTEEGDEEEDQA